MASGCGHSKFSRTHTLSHSFPYECPPIKISFLHLWLGLPPANLSNVHTCILILLDAVTLIPPSITTCPGQTVMFNCTANGVPIRWSVFTPNMNYTNLDISDANRKLMDGIIMADLIALDVSTMPITVVSSLTVNVTAELEGSKVQCLGVTNGSDTEIQSGLIHITGN